MNNLATPASDRGGLYADINGYVQALCSRVEDQMKQMNRSRPDIIIRERKYITVIEVMCPFETNLLKLHDYKNTK